REIRYGRVEVTDAVASGFERVVTFAAKPENFAPTPPAGAVVLAPYLRAVEAGFSALGPDQLELFRETTGPVPVEVIDAVLVRDEIPPGNPRDWWLRSGCRSSAAPRRAAREWPGAMPFPSRSVHTRRAAACPRGRCARRRPRTRARGGAAT